jgi:protease-4
VWTGAQAKDLGLVDHLGGMDVAIARAKALAKLKGDEPVRFEYFPPPRTLWEAITSRGEDNALLGTVRTLRQLAAGVRRIATVLLRAGGQEEVLTMPEVSAR